MRFYPLTKQAEEKGDLLSEYKAAWEVGVIRLGEKHLYFRKFRKVYYIPYTEIRNCFRRVMLVPAKLCCGKGEFKVENLVICTEEGELAQIQIPGTKAAKILMAELKKRVPHAQFTKPNASSENG